MLLAVLAVNTILAQILAFGNTPKTKMGYEVGM
jgi:hypothetical protein